MTARTLGLLTAAALLVAPAAHAATTITLIPFKSRWVNVVMTAPFTPVARTEVTGFGSRVEWGTGVFSNSSFHLDLFGSVRPFDVLTELPVVYRFGRVNVGNGPTPSPSLSQVDLEIDTDVIIDSTNIGTRVFKYRFYYDSTDNVPGSALCPFGGNNLAGRNINGCADNIRIEPIITSNIYDWKRVNYTVEFTGFTVGGIATNEYLLPENQTITLDLHSRITAVQSTVPEPASWVMMITGFGIIGNAARRRRSSATKDPVRFLAAR